VVMVDPGACGKPVRARRVGLEQPQGRFESGNGDEGKSGDPGRVIQPPRKIADEEKDEQVPCTLVGDRRSSRDGGLRRAPADESPCTPNFPVLQRSVDRLGFRSEFRPLTVVWLPVEIRYDPC
jgi:hypothetical protein